MKNLCEESNVVRIFARVDYTYENQFSIYECEELFMKITGFEIIVVGAPWRELTIVEVQTDEGITGVGEVRMVNKTDTLIAAIQELGDRYVVGSDPADLSKLAWN